MAEYAKTWGLLYRVLNERVAHNAVLVAEQSGFEAITCGHTHAAMDIKQGGKALYQHGGVDRTASPLRARRYHVHCALCIQVAKAQCLNAHWAGWAACC